MQLRGDPPAPVFPDVSSGSYKLEIQASGNECVDSAWYGSLDLTRDSLTVGPDGSTQPLTINLRADCATLSAELRPGGQQRAGVLLVIPASSQGEPRVFPVASQAFNSVTLSPGAYEVFAFSSIDGLEYANPEALRSYPSQSINLERGQKAELTVDLVERKGQ